MKECCAVFGFGAHLIIKTTKRVEVSLYDSNLLINFANPNNKEKKKKKNEVGSVLCCIGICVIL